MEYDRIRNAIEKSVAPGVTKMILESRLAELEKISARATNTIQQILLCHHLNNNIIIWPNTV